MKVIGFDGKEYSINFAKDCKDTAKSDLHKQAKDILRKCLPYTKIYEDVTLRGCRGTGGLLIADFLIPNIPLLVEVHGRQHYEYIKYFHKSKKNYQSYVKNDIIKRDWCEINDIVYIELAYDKIKEWKKIINEHIG